MGLCCHLGKGRLKLGRFNGEIFYTLREAPIVSTPQSDTSHQHQRCSCPHSPPGRLRYADRLRRGSWTYQFKVEQWDKTEDDVARAAYEAAVKFNP